MAKGMKARATSMKKVMISRMAIAKRTAKATSTGAKPKAKAKASAFSRASIQSWAGTDDESEASKQSKKVLKRPAYPTRYRHNCISHYRTVHMARNTCR